MFAFEINAAHRANIGVLADVKSKKEDVMKAVSNFRSKWTSVEERKRLLANLAIMTAAVAGFLTQLTRVSQQYFMYRTTTRVILDTPAETVFHVTSLCVRYHEILDKDRLFNETGIKWKEWANQEDAIELETLLTVEQIFRFTPDDVGIIQVTIT